MRRCLTPAFILAAMSFPLTAFADDNCPPGAWFCDNAPAVDDEDQEPAEALPEADDDDAEPPPPPEALPPPAPEFAPPPPPAPPRMKHRGHGRARGRGAQPPVVIYQPAPAPQASGPRTKIIIVAPGLRQPRIMRTPPRPRVVARPQCEEYAPPPPPAVVMPAPPPAPPRVALKRRWTSEWGVNLRLSGVGFGGDEDGKSKDAGMGGFGLGLRYRPVPAFALEAGIDVLGGTDFNGFDRVELPLTLNGILYVNPRSRAQFYFTGGVHWSNATLKSDKPDPRLGPDPDSDGFSTEYSYFGGQGGIGLEFRISRRVALNVDALAFVRKRTDDEGRLPEFTDPETGKTTNTSGGGLFRGGLTVWW